MGSVVNLSAHHGEDVSSHGTFWLVLFLAAKTLENRHIFLVVSKGCILVGSQGNI